MSSRFLVASIFMLFLIAEIGCQPTQPLSTNTIDETVTVTLPSPPQGQMLIYENDFARIEVTYNDFIACLSLNYQTERLDYVTHYFQTYSSMKISRGDDLACAADLLELGKAAVFDKSANSYASKIQVRTYSYFCGPTCGAGEKYFYFIGIFSLRGAKFLEVTDWVS